mmetsp:Transcript_14780/g.19636  ORF Transcript_14780/g.19636 Transcript_14780/m.19636 type:complete len:89 (-) Transcript_14780:762-1028(-)
MSTLLADAGFIDVKIEVKSQSREIIGAWMPGSNAEDYVASAYVTATKPVDAPQITDSACKDDVFRTKLTSSSSDIKLSDAISSNAAGC